MSKVSAGTFALTVASTQINRSGVSHLVCPQVLLPSYVLHTSTIPPLVSTSTASTIKQPSFHVNIQPSVRQLATCSAIHHSSTFTFCSLQPSCLVRTCVRSPIHSSLMPSPPVGLEEALLVPSVPLRSEFCSSSIFWRPLQAWPQDPSS